MKRLIPHYSLLATLLAVATGAQAQAVLSHNEEAWSGSSVNEKANIAYSSDNPVRLSLNPLSTYGVAKADYNYTTGDFRNIGTPEKKRQINVYFGGLKDLGKIRLSGHMAYHNDNDRNLPWNSTLWLQSANPFVLADSIYSKKTVESFDMDAALSWQVNDKWLLGASAGLAIGMSSDQDDPRPKITTSNVPLTIGAAYNINDNISVGLSGGVSLYHSSISYTIENPYHNYRYFLLKGMGDYYLWSSSRTPGYNRRYTGTTWHGAVQGLFKSNDGHWRDFIEASYSHGNQDARDGGSAYTFLGGDYTFSSINVNNRLSIEPSESLRHTILLNFHHDKGDGDWYDQKAYTDTAHANLTYYEVLAKTRVHENTRTGFNIGYHVDFLSLSDGKAFAEVGFGADETVIKHYTADGQHKQQWDLMNVRLAIGNTFAFGTKALAIGVHGGYWFPFKDRVMATAGGNIAAGDITGDYVLPQFEFLSSSYAQVGGTADFSFPVSATGVRMGITASVNSNLQSGNADYYSAIKSTSRTAVCFGVYARF